MQGLLSIGIKVDTLQDIFKKGLPISICTSRRPGRNRASSIKSLRFVIPDKILSKDHQNDKS